MPSKKSATGTKTKTSKRSKSTTCQSRWIYAESELAEGFCQRHQGHPAARSKTDGSRNLHLRPHIPHHLQQPVTQIYLNLSFSSSESESESIDVSKSEQSPCSPWEWESLDNAIEISESEEKLRPEDPESESEESSDIDIELLEEKLLLSCCPKQWIIILSRVAAPASWMWLL